MPAHASYVLRKREREREREKERVFWRQDLLAYT